MRSASQRDERPHRVGAADRGRDHRVPDGRVARGPSPPAASSPTRSTAMPLGMRGTPGAVSVTTNPSRSRWSAPRPLPSTRSARGRVSRRATSVEIA